MLIDQFLQLFTRFEVGNAFGGYADRITGLGISSAASTALADPKTAEASQFNFFPLGSSFR